MPGAFWPHTDVFMLSYTDVGWPIFSLVRGGIWRSSSIMFAYNFLSVAEAIVQDLPYVIIIANIIIILIIY